MARLANEPQHGSNPCGTSAAPELAAVLALDAAHPTPLRDQLATKLRLWLADKPDFFRLPSERCLAPLLKVSLITVKHALAKLANEGLIRRSVKGTFLVGHVLHSLADGHPFQHQPGVFVTNRKTIRLAVYEHWPRQRTMWQTACDRFNRSRNDVELRLEWLSNEVADAEAYGRFLREQRPDLAMTNQTLALRFRSEGLLAALPDDIVRKLHAPDYASFISGADRDGILTHSAPVHFPIWGTLWNLDLTGPVPATGAPFRASDLAQHILAIARKSSVPVLVPDAICLFLSSGFPLGDETAREGFMRALFEQAAQLQPVASRILWPKAYDAENLKMFLEGRAALFIGSLYRVLQRMPDVAFKWGGAFLVPRRGACLLNSWSGLSLAAGSAYEPAAEFIRFMLSPAGQELVIQNRLNAAFHWPTSQGLVTVVAGSSRAQLKAGARGLRFGDQSFSQAWYKYQESDFWSLLQAVTEGRLTPAQAQAQAPMTLWAMPRPGV